MAQYRSQSPATIQKKIPRSSRISIAESSQAATATGTIAKSSMMIDRGQRNHQCRRQSKSTCSPPWSGNGSRGRTVVGEVIVGIVVPDIGMPGQGGTTNGQSGRTDKGDNLTN